MKSSLQKYLVLRFHKRNEPGIVAHLNDKDTLSLVLFGIGVLNDVKHVANSDVHNYLFKRYPPFRF